MKEVYLLLILVSLPLGVLGHGGSDDEEETDESLTSISLNLEQIFIITLIVAYGVLFSIFRGFNINDSDLFKKAIAIGLMGLTADYLIFKYILLR